MELVEPKRLPHLSGIEHITEMHTDLTKKIPQEWKEILESVQVYFPQAVIAGGALRDLYHDKPIKDIDIFIPVANQADSEKIDHALSSIDPFYTTVANGEYTAEMANQAMPGFRTLYGVYRLSGWGVPVELIFIQAEENLTNVSSAFDINICQAEYNGNYATVSTAFMLGVETKMITTCNVNRADRQEARVKRVSEKYPEYMVLVRTPAESCTPYGDNQRD